MQEWWVTIGRNIHFHLIMIFKYKAYYNLLNDLGRNDYVVEVSELATRSFFDQLKSSSNAATFIKEKCIQYGIMVSYDPSNNYHQQIILGYIANVYHLAETFLYELQNEFNDLSKESWGFEQGKTKLTQTINFFEDRKRINSIDKIDSYLIETFEYYHQLRVYFSHKKTTSLKEVENKWKKAVSHFDKTLLLRYKISDGPKEISKLNFEDYYLFTQVAKDIAFQISSICYPEPEGMAKLVHIKRLKRHLDETERKKRIESYLKTEYGFLKENDSDDYVDKIDKYL